MAEPNLCAVALALAGGGWVTWCCDGEGVALPWCGSPEVPIPQVNPVSARTVVAFNKLWFRLACAGKG